MIKLTGERLLFVDDERGIRETLPAILRRYGFEVSVAATVAEATDEIKNHDFDLLLCDLNVEGEADGFEIVRAMREVNVIIILTGYAAMETAEDGIRLGIDDYIAKPATLTYIICPCAISTGSKRVMRHPSRPIASRRLCFLLRTNRRHPRHDYTMDNSRIQVLCKHASARRKA